MSQFINGCDLINRTVLQKLLALFVVWRLVLFIPFIIGSLLLLYRSEYHYTNILLQQNPDFFQGFLYAWANFDGVHYIEIARHGYTDQARFLPFFPLLIRIISYGLFFIRDELVRYYIAGLLFSNASTMALVWFFYKLIRLDFKSSLAYKTVFFLLLFPTSFFLGAVYAEGLFLLLVICSLLFARKQMWLVACIFASLACITRIVGIALIPALMVEMYMQNKSRITWGQITSLVIIPLPLIVYALFNLYKWHDVLYFIHAHTLLANGRSENFVLIPQTLVRYIKIFFSIPLTRYEWWIALLEFGMFFYAAWGLWFAWKKRVRLSYIVFATCAFCIPIFSGTFTGLPRYILVLFPFFIALAHVENKTVKMVIMATHILLLGILTLLFARGYYVG